MQPAEAIDRVVAATFEGAIDQAEAAALSMAARVPFFFPDLVCELLLQAGRLTDAHRESVAALLARLLATAASQVRPRLLPPSSIIVLHPPRCPAAPVPSAAVRCRHRC